ncbi:MAG: DUF4259 domain-containing protein [Gemmatimonadales bacterium]|nr:DUF4259 domain-containing protein [Gemmatimonadales bacterium]
MGTWGGGSFENDDARDWLTRLLASDDLAVVAAALEAATESGGYLMAPEASEAVAAAEIVAALLGRPASSLPDAISAWVAARQVSDAAPLALAATRALDVVENGSELRDLWQEAGGPSLESWRRAIYDLRSRLSPRAGEAFTASPEDL